MFDHLALRDMLEDPALPFARIVAVIDPMYRGSQLLASQLLRYGQQLPVNSIICALPGQNTEQQFAGPEYLPLVASVCLGGEELGVGGTLSVTDGSGFVFGRAMAIVERSTYLDGWPQSVAAVALEVASLGTEVEERPAGKGQWLFFPPAPEIIEEAPAAPPAPTEPVEGEEGEEGEPPPEPEPVAAEAEEGEEGEKPPEPEKASYTGTNVHAWLFNGLNQCYASETWIEKLCGDGVSEAEVRGCKEWLAKTEKAGLWGPVSGVRDETARVREEERLARLEAIAEAKRQRQAERKRIKEEAAAAAAAAAAAEEQRLLDEAAAAEAAAAAEEKRLADEAEAAEAAAVAAAEAAEAEAAAAEAEGEAAPE